MQIGIVGKTNTGKSTFFSAATLVAAEIANRPFVTIKPNQGTSYVAVPCVHAELKVTCEPVNSKCTNGMRLIPITLLDVAGLVPDAWQGKGLGNMFLNDLMQAQALVHVLDTSGRTDFEGNPTTSHNPADDVRFLEREITFWLKGILQKNWQKIGKTHVADLKQSAELLAKQLTGLGILEPEIKLVLEKGGFGKPSEWNDEEMLRFVEEIRKESKPILIAANKMDVPESEKNLKKLREEFPEKVFVPVCAEAELALRRAAEHGLIDYVPGASDFKELQQLQEKQKHALNFIRENVLKKFGNTGVQQAINETAFKLLDLIVVYPVEDQHKFASGKGNILPDAYLLKRGSSAFDLAVKIHSSFGERFVAAVDCRTGQRIGKENALKNNDVVKIQLSH